MNKQLCLFDTEEAVASGEAAATALPCLNSICSNEPTRVSSYFARLSYALRLNIEAFIEKHGVNNVGFFTITGKDEESRLSAKVFQARYNSFATGFLREYFKSSIMVCERGSESGFFHAHLLIAFDFDIRTGFDFAAVSNRDYRSVNPRLLTYWRLVRMHAARYGLGRTEILPIKSNAVGVARYVSDYVCKHFRHRVAADKGAKLVRYSGGARVCSTRFAFDSVRSRLWRRKIGVVAQVAGIIDLPEFAQRFGERWAHHLARPVASMQLPEYRDKAEAQADGFDVSFVPDDVVNLKGFKGRRCVTQFQTESDLREFFKIRSEESVFEELAQVVDWSKVNEPINTDGMRKPCNHWRVIHAIDRENREYWKKTDEEGVPVVDGVLCPF